MFTPVTELGAEQLAEADKLAKLSNSVGLCGFILVELKRLRYWDGIGFFRGLGSDTERETPYCFTSLRRAKASCKTRNARFFKKTNAAVVAFWIHPEAHYKTGELYARITGDQLRQFPGSPSQ